MNHTDARSFIAEAVGKSGGTWADLGAGGGTFTRALLSLLDPGSRVYAVDRDPHAIEQLSRLGTAVIPVHADITVDLHLPEQGLDGLLLANTLHFVPDAARALERLAAFVKPDGRVVMVEYDRRERSRWVPYPIPSTSWPGLAAAANLTNARIVARRPSEYAGELYVAVANRAVPT